MRIWSTTVMTPSGLRLRIGLQARPGDPVATDPSLHDILQGALGRRPQPFHAGKRQVGREALPFTETLLSCSGLAGHEMPTDEQSPVHRVADTLPEKSRCHGRPWRGVSRRGPQSPTVMPVIPFGIGRWDRQMAERRLAAAVGPHCLLTPMAKAGRSSPGTVVSWRLAARPRKAPTASSVQVFSSRWAPLGGTLPAYHRHSSGGIAGVNGAADEDRADIYVFEEARLSHEPSECGTSRHGDVDRLHQSHLAFSGGARVSPGRRTDIKPLAGGSLSSGA